MKAIIQRVLSASVTVDSAVVSFISRGLLVFAAIAPDDTPTQIEALANHILKLKAWDSWKKSVVDLDYEVLLVSQFTLLASTKKGNKPDFHGACPPEKARAMYQQLVDRTREVYVARKEGAGERVKDGVFGAMMQVSLVNDGPVTFEINLAPPPTTTGGNKKEKPKGSGQAADMARDRDVRGAAAEAW